MHKAWTSLKKGYWACEEKSCVAKFSEDLDAGVVTSADACFQNEGLFWKFSASDEGQCVVRCGNARCDTQSGESAGSCSEDCIWSNSGSSSDTSIECLQNSHCVSKIWVDSQVLKAWKCNDEGQCVVDTDFDACGNSVCDANSQWSSVTDSFRMMTDY